jgi:hypothetical protein
MSEDGAKERVPVCEMKLLGETEDQWTVRRMMVSRQVGAMNDEKRRKIAKWAKGEGYTGAPLGTIYDDRITFDFAKKLMCYLGYLKKTADDQVEQVEEGGAVVVSKDGLAVFWETYYKEAKRCVSVARNNRIARLKKAFLGKQSTNIMHDEWRFGDRIVY